MASNTWWWIVIHYTELREDPDNANGLLLPVSIQLDLPIDRSPIAKNPINPIDIEKVFLWNQSENEYVSKVVFSKDDAAWEESEERVCRTFACTLRIPNKNCFQKPIRTLGEALSIEVYDTTSGLTPWCYSVAQLTSSSMSDIHIQIDH